MPAPQKDFGDILHDFFTTSPIQDRFVSSTEEAVRQTAETSSEYLKQFGRSIRRGVEAGSEEWGKSSEGSLIGIGDPITTLGAFAQGAKEAPTFLAGGTIGTLATPIDFAVMGGLQAVAPSAAESLGQGIDKVYNAAGGRLEDKALVDTVLGGLGISGAALGAGKLASRAARTAERAASATSRGLENAISKSFEGFGKEAVPSADFMESLADSLETKRIESGRNLNTNDVISSIEEVSGKEFLDSPVSKVPERDFSSIPQEAFDIVGERTSANSKTRKQLLNDMESAGIRRDKAGIYLDNVMSENRKVADKFVPKEKKIKDAISRLYGKSEMGKDSSLKKFKYDLDGQLLGDDLNLLENEGILERSDKVSDGNYSFVTGEKASKYFTPSEMRKFAQSGGVTHYPSELYDRVVAEKEAKPSNLTFEEAANAEIEKAIDNPDDIARTLNRIEEANGDVAKLERPPTSKALYKRISKALDEADITGEEISPAAKSEIRSLARRIGEEVDQAFDYAGNLDRTKFDEFWKKAQLANKEGFSPVKRLPAPKNLSSMLRRDASVARTAFASGAREAKNVADMKIKELREKAKASEGKLREEFNARADKIAARVNQKADWRKNLIERVKNVYKNEDGNYVFYGTKADADRIAGKMSKQINEVSSFAGYERVTENIAKEIEKANIDILNSQITRELKEYVRPAGKTSAKTRKIDPEARMALEVIASAKDRYTKIQDPSVLKKALDDIRYMKSVGKEKFKEMTKLKREEVSKLVNEAQTKGVQGVGNDALAYDSTGVAANLYRMHMSLMEPTELLRTIFKGDYTNPGFSQMLKTLESSKDVFLLEQKLIKEVLEPLDEAGLSGKEATKRIGAYMMSQQDDWGKRVYDKDGNFVGNNVFEGIKFETEADYKKYMSDTKELIEGSKKATEAIENWKKLRDEIDSEERMVSRTYDGFEKGKVGNYYPQRAIRDGVIQEFGDNVLEPKSFSTGYMESRQSGKNVKYDPNFFKDTQRFIRTQGRYAKVRPNYGKMKDLVEGGIMEGANKVAKNVVADLMADLAKPEAVKSNVLSRATSRLSKLMLFLRPTSVLSQYLTLADARLRIPGDEIVRSLGASTDTKQAAIGASKALQVANGLDFLIHEKQQLADANMVSKYLDKALDFGVSPIGKTDLQTKTAVWLGAYADWYNKNMGKKFNYSEPDFSHKDGVRYADNEMESIVGSKEPARIPPALREPYIKAFLMLQTFVVKRYGQLSHSLPEQFRADKVNGSKILTAYAISSLAGMGIGLGYKELLQAIGEGMGWPVGDDKTIEQRITGEKNPSKELVLMNLAKNLIVSNIPGGSNVSSVLGYDRTGIGVADYVKNFADGVSGAYKSLQNGEEQKATQQSLKAISGLFGYPGELASKFIPEPAKAKKQSGGRGAAPIRRTPPKRPTRNTRKD